MLTLTIIILVIWLLVLTAGISAEMGPEGILLSFGVGLVIAVVVLAIAAICAMNGNVLWEVWP